MATVEIREVPSEIDELAKDEMNEEKLDERDDDGTGWEIEDISAPA